MVPLKNNNDIIIFNNQQYDSLVENIETIASTARQKAVKAIDYALVEMNWNIGRYIVEFEQQGNHRAEYGSQLILQLSKDLSLRIGKGFSRSNLFNMRLLYLRFPKFQTLSGKLSWSHYVELIGIENELERNYYFSESINQNWSVRNLRDNIGRGLFYQFAESKNQTEVLSLAHGNQIYQPVDIIKNTYYLDFLGIKTPNYSEGELEDALINHMEQFLLELGKGFAFIGRQYRLTIDNEDYYADLVFYHIILKCYVIIDLKRGKVRHEDIGQMNMYLGYFAYDKNIEGDNPPIGIILAADKNDVMVQYATYGMDSNLFVAKYQLYLPNAEQLKQLVLAGMEKAT